MKDTLEEDSFAYIARAHRRATQRFRIEEYQGLLTWFYPIDGVQDAYLRFHGDSFDDIKSVCVQESLPLPQVVFAATLEDVDPDIEMLEASVAAEGCLRPDITDDLMLELHSVIRDFFVSKEVRAVVPDFEVAIDLPVEVVKKEATPDRSLN